MSNPIRIVIDTQLFFRAAMNRRSLPARIIYDLRHAYQLITSEEITAEIMNVLQRPELRKKFNSLTDEVAETILSLLSDAEWVTLTEIPQVVRDPKDDIFLACAVAAKAHYLVSEDKDLLVLNPYQDIAIINALDFLHILQPPQE